MGILEVRGRQFRLNAVPFTQIRSFLYKEINLASERRLDVHDPKVEEKMKTVLIQVVQELVNEARQVASTVVDINRQSFSFKIRDPHLVILRYISIFQSYY